MENYISIIMNIIEEINPYIDVDEDTELIESGILDSLSIVYVVTQIEDKYDMYINEKEVVPANFRTVSSICNLLLKCK